MDPFTIGYFAENVAVVLGTNRAVAHEFRNRYPEYEIAVPNPDELDSALVNHRGCLGLAWGTCDRELIFRTAGSIMLQAATGAA